MARGLGGVMVALAVRDGPALVRFQAKPLGELAQRESDRFASDRSWVRIPYSPFVVGPDIKMAPHSIGFVGSVVEHLPCKQQVVGSSPARSFESRSLEPMRDRRRTVGRETFNLVRTHIGCSLIYKK